MKLERTFVFAALIALAVLGYGISGAFFLEPQQKEQCLKSCANLISEAAEACLFDGKYYKKEFFAKNICDQTKIFECLQQFCRPALEIPQENLAECNKLCS